MASISMTLTPVASAQAQLIARPSIGGTAQLQASVKPARLGAALHGRTSAITRAAAADVSLESFEAPTPDVPSQRMMVDFLMTYGRMLKNVSGSGESVASAGANVLDRVKVGVVSLIDGQQQVAKDSTAESELRACLVELQKDINMIQRYQANRPPRAAVDVISLRCVEAARLLRRL